MGPEYFRRLQTMDRLSEVPQGWSVNSHSASTLPIICEPDYPPLDQVIEFEHERRWTEATGLRPQDSHFTIIVPIRNEETFLPSFFETLMLSDIPDSAHVNFIFVTNDCDKEDKSIDIITEFMKDIGETCTMEFRDEELASLQDSGLEKEYLTTQLNNLHFMHLNTQTAGKPNALNIGNEIALMSDHAIAICIDANNFVEPTTIRTMFAQAYDSICRQQNGTAILSGLHKTDVKPTRLKPLYNIAKTNMEGVGRKRDIEVSGCLMSWDTHWLKEIGGVPPVACDDYALGVYARKTDRKIKHVANAVIWGYDANNLQDRLECYARAVRGRMQLLDIDPYLRDIVEEDFHFMRDFPKRLAVLLEWIKENPTRAPFRALKFLMWEDALIKGRREYAKDPTSQSWKACSSTK